MEAVLDASALLALLTREPGAERVEAVIGHAALCSVNYSETVAVLADKGVPDTVIRTALDRLALNIVPFDRDLAFRAGSLRPVTRGAGLSLGDRACLSLAMRLAVPALTADRAWKALALPVAIDIIR